MGMAVEAFIRYSTHPLIAFECVILVVIRDREVPPVKDLYLIGQGQVHFLLQVLVIGRQQLDVIVLIMGVVIGIFDQQPCAPAVKPLILPGGLHKTIPIPESLSVAPDIIDDGSRHTTLRPVVIRMDAPETRGTVVMMQSQFSSDGIDVSVLPNSGGVIGGGSVR